VAAAREAAWNNAELLWHLDRRAAAGCCFSRHARRLTALASKTLLVAVP
jgi:hypothetical protein